MEQTNANGSGNRHMNSIIIAGVIVLLTVIFMYFQDQQQRNMQLHRLEARMDLMEERGWPRQQNQQNNVPSRTGGRVF